jgi:hypothetical protein
MLTDDTVKPPFNPFWPTGALDVPLVFSLYQFILSRLMQPIMMKVTEPEWLDLELVP